MRYVWVTRLSILFYGSICGLAFQFLKIDLGGDHFWNIRLPIVLLLGILLFYVVNYLSGRVIRFFVGRYDASIQIRDMKTYLPLCLVFLFPLQKMGMDIDWRKPFLLYFLGAYAFAVIAMKCALVAKIKKDTVEKVVGQESPGIGKGWLCIPALVAGMPLFCVHQLTLSFDDLFHLYRPGGSEAVYLRHDDVTRKTFPYNEGMDFEAILPYERSRAIVGYKMLDEPEEKSGNAVPMNFDLLVTDGEGKLVAEKHFLMDPADESSSRWRDFDLDLTGEKGSSLRFRLKIRPALFQIKSGYLLEFLFRNPLDFQYFENQTIPSLILSEPVIIPREKTRPNIILISLDTLRADYLGCYGYERNVSPTIDAFARENIMYENAFCQSTWTLPSHLSMLTSRFPNELDTTHFSMYHKTPERELKQLKDVALAEILREKGYYCAAFTDGVFLSSYYGFYKGFHVYDENYGSRGNSFALAEDWIAEHKDKDFFLFVHTYLIHDYSNNDGLFGEANIGDDFGELLESVRVLFPEIENPKSFFSSGRTYGGRSSYAIRVKLVDFYIQDFFSFLEKENLYDDAMILITSDHGHSFGERHNNDETIAVFHGRTPPYDPEIHVPLILKLPARMSQGPLVVKDDVRLLDVAPTILAALGHDTVSQFRGRPILPGFEPKEEDAYPFVYATWAKPGGSIRENGKKYIDVEGGGEEFYDLTNDPGETRNLAPLQLEEMLELKMKYSEFISETGAGSVALEDAVGDAPPELREQLRALGYIE